jgi:PadR family transcriptional regulator, regulatory protein PadR
MEQKGWVVSEWKASENNRGAKYCRPTAAGRKQARAEERSSERLVSLMAGAMRYTPEAEEG